MMLQALYEYARRERLLEDPDAEQLAVNFFIEVADDGRFLGLISTADEDGRVPRRSVPRMPKRTVAIAPGFFVDNCRYVLGIGGDAEKARRNEACAESFRKQVQAVAEETGDPGARAAAAFLSRIKKELARLLKQRAEWTGEERIAFRWSGDDEQLVHERPALRQAWARRRTADAEDRGAAMRCLVTGGMASPTRLHPSIKNVPNAQSSGAALVSFNEEAFCSHGLEQGENAPMSRAAAEGYATALNHLLARDGKRRHRQGVALGDGAVALFWTREPHPMVDTVLQLFEPEGSQQAVHMAESPLRGLEPAPLDETRFYALTLGGNAARVVVRDWFETSIGDLKRNVHRYFADLLLAGRQDAPLPLWQLLRAVEAPGRQGVPPDLSSKLLGAALRGRPFPRELLSAALRRLRVPAKDDEPAFLLHARCALIKATLRRLPRSTSSPLEVTVSLDPGNTQVPYLLGRLFAVLDRLQYAALGNVNAGIKDRYFGAAMANPGLVFPRLLRLSNHHAAKAERAGWLERLKEQIVGRLPPEHLPTTLNLEDQGLFAVGYYHQREDFFSRLPPAPSPAAPVES